MPAEVFFERHHRSAGGADVHEPGPYEVLPADRVDLRPARAKPLSPQMAAKVLVPLCRFDLAQHFQDYVEAADYDRSTKGLVSFAWSALQAAGFKQYVCFVRGFKGREELVVVLAEGTTSWPVRQLTPDAVDFLEVQAL